MSQEGVQNRGKDGGAQENTHEANFDDEILYVSKESYSSDVREMADPNSLHFVQDGSIRGLLSVDTEDLDSYNYDQTVMDNNSEWMKTRCKGLEIEFDAVGEENVSDLLGLDSESRADSLMTMGGQFLTSAIPEDNGIIICSDGTSLSTSSSNIVSASDPKCSDVMQLCNLSDDFNSRTQPTMCYSSNNLTPKHSLISIRSSSSVFGGGDLATTLDLESSNVRFCEIPHRNTQGQINTMDLESLSLQQVSLQNIVSPHLVTLTSQSSQNILRNNSVTVSVCESSVGESLPNFLGIDSDSSLPLGNDLCVNDCDANSSTLVDSLQQSVFLSSCDGLESLTADSMMPNLTSKNGMNDPGNVTLATISVSTDKEANSTQILVNTSQGQQLYMINTADLNQATSALMPLAQPVEGLSATHTVAGIPAPGYILLPVVDGNIQGPALHHGSSVGDSNQMQRSNERWVCSEPGCRKVFSKLSKLKIHAMQHTGERPFKCSRLGCDWAFTTGYKLKRHEESHEGKKDFYCDYEGCSRKFTTIYNLNSHRRLHERPCTETCPEKGCGQQFPTKRQLDIHMRIHCGEEKTFKCPHPGCKTIFFSPHSMGSHARIHHEKREDDLRCNFKGCGKTFFRLCRLKQHMRQHTGEKPYACSFEGCSWAFTTASKLKRHQAKHLGLRKFQCHLCGKGFMRAEHLKGHLITHSGVKPFTCPIQGCDASFTAKSTLYVHISKHDKDGSKLTFFCPMDGCSKKYTAKLSLRNHIFKHYLSASEGGDTSTMEMAQLLVKTVTDIEDKAQPTENKSIIDEKCHEEMVHEQEGDQEMKYNLCLGTGSNSRKPQPRITLEPSTYPYRIKLSRSGSARTDFHGNHLLSNQARRRWHQKRDSSQSSSSMDTDILPNHEEEVENDSSSLDGHEQNAFLTPEPSLSGLTFRDPDTGITYVQTQLLQDDPPTQSVIESGYTVGFTREPVALEDNSGSSILDIVPTSHFTSTTINLQDLE